MARDVEAVSPRTLTISLLCIAAILITPHSARSQTVHHGLTPSVFFDAVAFAADAPDSTMVDLYLAVPYGTLAFDRTDGGFTARYQTRFTISQPSGTVFDTTFIRSVRTSSFAMTAGDEPGFDFFQQRVPIGAGTYTAAVELVDLRSTTSTTIRRDVEARDRSGEPLALSGLLLVGRIREDSTGYVITPMFTDNVSTQGADGYFLFFEAYNETGHTDFRFDVVYRESAGGPALETQRFQRTLSAGRSQQWLHLPARGLPRGGYVVEVDARMQSDSSKVLARASRPVVFRGDLSGMPISSEELDEKIEQLRYVAGQEQIDAIRHAGDFNDKRTAYADFWNALDPSPGTPENEAMQEYFARVAYANENFRGYTAGWLTDMGRVYIIFGPPDRTEDDPFRSDNRATQTWHYFSSGREFIFIDDSGFGDFRLSTPLSPSVKYQYGR